MIKKARLTRYKEFFTLNQTTSLPKFHKFQNLILPKRTFYSWKIPQIQNKWKTHLTTAKASK